jgi:hypothetical protein
MAKQTELSDTPKGVADHPARFVLQEMWEAGQRGKALVSFLEENDYPPLSANTIGRYGQRFWTEREIVDFEGPIEELAGLAKTLSENNVGSVNKFSFKKQTAPRLEQGVLVDKETTTLTAEIRPTPSLSPASIPDIHVHLPSEAPRKLSKANNARLGIFLPDMQIGYHRDTQGALTAIHDEQAIDIAFQITGYLNETYKDEGGVDLVVFAGDNLDLPEFSSHRSAPGYLGNTQLAIDRAGAVCATSRKLAPNAQQVWLGNNHETRLINTLTDKVPGLVGLSKENDPKRTPVISIPYLLNMDKYGIDYIEGYPDGEFWANEYLRFEHGSVARSAPGATAARHLSSGVSTLYGHVHRREVLYQRVNTKKGSRIIFASSPGSLCRTDGLVPSAKTGIQSSGKQGQNGHAENWHQGIAVFWYENKGHQRSWLENVEIEDGNAYFRGVEFSSNVDKNGNL